MIDSVKRACEQWILAGHGDECFWEHWPECPCEDSLTPNQVMAAVTKLESENQRLRDHMEEINAIVDECEYDKKTRKTVDRLRSIYNDALKGERG